MTSDPEIVAALFGKPFRFVRGYAPPSAGIDPYSGMLGHSGWDISAPKGTPVYALASGTVTRASFDAHGGNTLYVTNGNLSDHYAHLADFAVPEGAVVHAGQLIGHVGQTGVVTGPHLHVSHNVDGKAVDPTHYLAGLAASQPARAADAASDRAGTTPTPDQAAAAAAANVRRDPTHALAAYGLLAAGLLLFAVLIFGGLI